jgi:hypothetical protein
MTPAVSRCIYAAELIRIHKEAWIPTGIALVGTVALGAWLGWPTTWMIAPIALALFVANEWRRDGAYRKNAQDTLIQRFHHTWRLTQHSDPDNTPTLVAVHLERATRTETRAIRQAQGRHAIGALSMKLVVRPNKDQAAAKDWVAKFQASKKAEYGFQSVTDPTPAPLDNNSLQFVFGQERLPTEVRAVVA